MTHTPTRSSSSALFVSALGVVFGDIGTSPLYTLRECFRAASIEVTTGNIYGILAAIAWSLFLIITIKYVSIVLRADNRGEGGLLAITVLAMDQFATKRRRTTILIIGLLGAALFYGDAIITPAISVLSAVEGLKLITPAFTPWVVPLALVLLASLFAVQRYGTQVMGQSFGPIMLVWFGVLGVLGLNQIILNPTILHALNPLYAVQFATNHPLVAFFTMGAVVLAVTGGEALYADMGHFGRKPIQRAWLFLVGPCLLINYFGQGALILANPETLHNPFFLMAPGALLIPLVILATLATIIASQAVISGAYSLTHQAIQLGYLPRMEVRYTSSDHAGQIYIPALNGLLFTAIVLLVLEFHTSSNLAAAYGVAVTGCMLLTTVLTTTVLLSRNRWHPLLVALFAGVFFALEGLFLAAALTKVPTGGWFPLMAGAAIFFIMHTWITGREASRAIVQAQTPPLEHFIWTLNPNVPHVTRTAVFFTSNLNHTPPALIYNVNHNAVMHAQTIILKISRAPIPRYPASERFSIHHHPHNITTVQVTYGFLERPNVPHLLSHELPHHGLTVRHPDALSYFLSTHTYVPSENTALNPLQEPVFVLLDKLAQSAVNFFHLPRKHVIEIGNQIEI